MTRYVGPLLTLDALHALRRASAVGADTWTGSLDLGRSEVEVRILAEGFEHEGRLWPWPESLKPRTIYWFDGADWQTVSRWAGRLYKLVPTEWGVPTFEIDGIKMLPSARLSPLEDARIKVKLVQPRGARVLDTCGGLGYFAACALEAGVNRIESTEKSAEVLWLRQRNPWSPDPETSSGRLQLQQGDITTVLPTLEAGAFDAVLHDPPRFGIAGELYSLAFYEQLLRVLRPGGRLFHYTGSPNRLTSGRDVPAEVTRRLQQAGFKARPALDGVFAEKPQGSRAGLSRR